MDEFNKEYSDYLKHTITDEENEKAKKLKEIYDNECNKILDEAFKDIDISKMQDEEITNLLKTLYYQLSPLVHKLVYLYQKWYHGFSFGQTTFFMNTVMNYFKSKNIKLELVNQLHYKHTDNDDDKQYNIGIYF